MTTFEPIAIIVPVGYAIYRQTRTNEITGHDRSNHELVGAGR